METPKPDIPPRPATSPLIQENARSHTFSDFDNLQNTISRPCLPQKLRTTQRSMSCSSLVQVIKDLSISIWSQNNKNTRNSVPVFSEKTAKDFEKCEEKSKLPSVSSIISNAEDASSKVIFQKQKSSVNGSTEKVFHSTMSAHTWYHDIDARRAEKRLLTLGEDGAFLIRPTSKPTNKIQHTACVVYSGRVLNMHISQKLNGQYALGNGKQGEKTFSSISDLIKYHQEVPIEIRPVGTSSSGAEWIYVYFRVTPPK